MATGGGRQLPVGVEHIAEHVLDLRLSWERLVGRGDGLILGGLRPGQRQIVLNELALSHFTEFPGSERFTIAHEIGHWMLHLEELPTVGTLFPELGERPYFWGCESGPAKPRREIQADRFAGALLLPRSILREIASEDDFSAWPSLYRLADRAGCSITALTIRLEQIGVVSILDGVTHPVTPEAWT
jgi:hypothetical protein